MFWPLGDKCQFASQGSDHRGIVCVRHVRANPFLHEIDSVLPIHQFISIQSNISICRTEYVLTLGRSWYNTHFNRCFLILPPLRRIHRW